MATAATAHSSEIAKIAALIKGIRIAMLTTTEHDGSLYARPMATQELAFDGTLWFFTEASSHKVDAVREDAHVNVAYVDPKDQRYVSLSGRARLVRDPAKIKELWSPMLKVWFKDGLEDPDLALLKIEVTGAQYWDAPASRMVRLFGYVKALATGHPYDAGENRTLDLHSR